MSFVRKLIDLPVVQAWIHAFYAYAYKTLQFSVFVFFLFTTCRIHFHRSFSAHSTNEGFLLTIHVQGTN